MEPADAVTETTMPTTRPGVGISWYAAELDGVEPLVQVLARWSSTLSAVAENLPVLAGLLLFLVGLRRPAVVMTNTGIASKVCMLCSAVTGRRNVVLMEFIQHRDASSGGFAGGLFSAVKAAVRRWVFARSVRVAHVLSESDVAGYAALHHLPETRFSLIRWPASTAQDDLPELSATGRTVMASGKRVDWDTVFAAAAGTDWEVTAVCTRADEPDVRRLAAAAGVRADIHVDIPGAAHHALMRAADVYVLAVAETGTSIGHIRVMNAVDAGVPLVASDVAALRGYVDARSAALVAPADPTGLRECVESLLGDPAARDALRRAARRRAGSSMSDYVADLSHLVAGAGYAPR